MSTLEHSTWSVPPPSPLLIAQRDHKKPPARKDEGFDEGETLNDLGGFEYFVGYNFVFVAHEAHTPNVRHFDVPDNDFAVEVSLS